MELKNIKLVLSDVDGVMTDTRIYMAADGSWRRFFSIYDGMGFKRLQKAGIQVGIITASDAEDVRSRFKFLEVDYFHEKAKNKIENLKQILEISGCSAQEVAYIGDDLMDVEVIEAVGFGVTVPHALEEIKEKSDYVTQREGGHGAVREVCEMILKSKGVA